jgi:hypothetical protein
MVRIERYQLMGNVPNASSMRERFFFICSDPPQFRRTRFSWSNLSKRFIYLSSWKFPVSMFSNPLLGMEGAIMASHSTLPPGKAKKRTIIHARKAPGYNIISGVMAGGRTIQFLHC